MSSDRKKTNNNNYEQKNTSIELRNFKYSELKLIDDTFRKSELR